MSANPTQLLLQAQQPQQGPEGFIITMVLMIIIFYFLLIRPQKKRADKHKEMVKQLSAGDQVITNSGIFGKISAIDDTSVTLEVAKGTRIRVPATGASAPNIGR